MDEAILALLIPIITVLTAATTLIAWFLFRFLQKRSLYRQIHLERMASIEKGLALPPWPEGLFRKQAEPESLHPRRYLRHGLVWLFLGITSSIALYSLRPHHPETTVLGFIPASIGLAQLLYYKLEKKRASKQEPTVSDPPPTAVPSGT